MGDLLGIFAFALLWLFLVGFFVVLFTMLRDDARKLHPGDHDPNHGL